jgi:hypothetical protein
MHIMDIAQNSITAKCSLLKIEIFEDMDMDNFSIRIEDNGIGISPEMLEVVTDPYVTTRTTRKVGLGLSLLKMNAERTGGGMLIESTQNKGTIVSANFVLNHLDRPPLGDIAGTIVLLVAANPAVNILFQHKTNTGEFIFDTNEINATLEGVSISEPSVVRFLKEMINENLQAIKILR